MAFSALSGELSVGLASVQAKCLIFWGRGRCCQDFGLLNRAYHQAVRILLSSFHVTESESILVGFPIGLRPSHVRNPFAEKLDHERIFALDSARVNGEELRYSVRHNLLERLTGYRLEAA